MTSRRWGTLVSGLVFVLTLTAAGGARAQFDFQGVPASPWGGQFGPGYGTGVAYGSSSYGYGSSGGAAYGGFGSFPLPGYEVSLGLVPQTTTSFPSLFNGVTAVPGWSGPSWSGPRHRVRRRR